MSGGTKLFVYGVNRSCPKDLLEEKFSKHGAVSDVYITEKGYAFVTMDDAGDAQAAVDELNGTKYAFSVFIHRKFHWKISTAIIFICFIQSF
jgi:RNA recognition motif-containing protein